MKSHRVVWPCQGVADVESFEPPSPQEGEVLLQSRVTLISPGTERAFFLGMPNAEAQFPVYPGYSCVAEVVESSSHDFTIGDRVVCQSPHASHWVVSDSECVPVPENVADEEAVFFSLGAIALQGVRKAHVELGESAVVIGAGLVGVLAAQMARLCGAAPVIVIDKDEQRLKFARTFVADAAVLADENLSTSLATADGGSGAQVVIEATGHPQAIPQAFALAGRFGRVVLLGTTRGLTEQVDFCGDVHKKGLTIIGAHNSTRPQRDRAPGWWTLRDDQETVLKVLSCERLEVAPLVTHRFDWHEAPRAYELLVDGDTSALGMLLDWRSTPPVAGKAHLNGAGAVAR